MTPPVLQPEPPRALRIAEEATASVLAHARRCYPHEACGALAIALDGEVTAAYPIVNTAHSPVAFTLDPAGHYAAANEAEAKGWEIGGVFHSHPEGAAVPSPADVAQPFPADWVHLIVGFVPDLALRAWDGQFRELALIAAE